MADRRRQVGPDVVATAVAALIGADQLIRGWPDAGYPRTQLLAVAVTVAAAGVARRVPGAALALLWVALGLHVMVGVPPMPTDLVVVWVAFATGRWGHPLTVVASGLSIPLAAAAAVPWVERHPDSLIAVVDEQLVGPLVDRLGPLIVVVIGVAGIAVFVVPLLVGLLVRMLAAGRRARDRQRDAEAAAVLAQTRAANERRLAELRAAQTGLARDVHDVVGHSLTVILAQADSAQYLDDVDRLRGVLATVSTSARSSLEEVQRVLDTTRDGASPPGTVAGLVDGLRAAGHEVTEVVVGVPRPLPDGVATTVFRVTQEMLTNAVRHGVPAGAVRVEQVWEDAGVTVRVKNEATVPDDATGGIREGRGVTGMAARLTAVGGRLDTSAPVGADGRRYFVAEGWIPWRG